MYGGLRDEIIFSGPQCLPFLVRIYLVGILLFLYLVYVLWFLRTYSRIKINKLIVLCSPSNSCLRLVKFGEELVWED